jgi:molybdate transport system substrate-binding protein
MKPLLRCLALLAVLVGAAVQAADLRVSAAASLGDAFREIADNYQRERPGTRVLLNLGASGALLQQLAKGAPVDVVASADQESMQRAVRMGLASAARDFAGNRLVLAVPADSELALARLEDLRGDGVRRIAIGNPDSVPAGRYARQALQAAGLWLPLQGKLVKTRNVRQALSYLARGEVDAALVYQTDVLSLPDRVHSRLQVPHATVIRYPIAVTADSDATAEAARFVAYVLSADGQAVLGRHGFLAP